MIGQQLSLHRSTKIKAVRVADFHFELPEELIAQSPPPVRGSSRMIVLDRSAREYRDNFFRNLPELLHPGDLLILNDSRVIPARIYATRARGLHTQAASPDPTGRIEVLLTHQVGPHEWTALVRPGLPTEQRRVERDGLLVVRDLERNVIEPDRLPVRRFEWRRR